MNTRYELLNYLIGRYHYKRYLEIGLDSPDNCFNKIECINKVSVDPYKGQTVDRGDTKHYRLTSDEFFKTTNTEFDLVFVDGLHECNQVLRDIKNALSRLRKGGTIVVHDCNPTAQNRATDNRVLSGPWFGTVWLAWLTLRSTKKNISMRTWMNDCGCGIIRKGSQKTFNCAKASWEVFDKNRLDILKPVHTDGLGRLK